jgi:hypothetical protein
MAKRMLIMCGKGETRGDVGADVMLITIASGEVVVDRFLGRVDRAVSRSTCE